MTPRIVSRTSQGVMAIALACSAAACAANTPGRSSITQAPAAATAASTPAVSAATAGSPCDAPEHRQFDFWVGHWQVHAPNGKVAGTNRIERLLGGCVLQENWIGAGGGTGTSLNFYDRASGEWNQVWVDGRGGVLRLTGGLRDGAMVMTGTVPGAKGGTVQQRITWTPLPGGAVRQYWETSTDGQQWQASFDGTYTRTGG